MGIQSQKIRQHLDQVLGHLYINPLEKCNLACKICYTRKTSPILSNQEILTFIDRYLKVHELQTVTFCGGEVCALAAFPTLVNTLTARGMFIQIITNGTIDVLDQLESPNSINMIVSIDGLTDYHDANRGAGNFAKSIAFLQKARELGFHREIFSILTHQNLAHIDQFEEELRRLLGSPIQVTYHPRKPPEYLAHHPVSNIVGVIDGFDFLSPDEVSEVLSTRRCFPPKDLGCYQIALVSNGKVYGCCEGVTPIGSIDDDIPTLFEHMNDRLIAWEQQKINTRCLGCTQPDFVCGIKQYLQKDA